jgi:isoamylase
MTDMRVDGFRFDLAPVLARTRSGFDPESPIFAAIRSDPVLAYAKLIAEPWDVGPGGYQLGRFPAGWSEWNDRYRDTVRAYWRGDRRLLGAVAERLAGSSDLFRQDGRRPSASINFVTAHDGFTLHDLVAYNHRDNAANLEANKDGHSDNLSWNCGVEGHTCEPAILGLRRRQMRNLLATLFLSQGAPMLQAGDEFARTQGGNNNAYCQDNAISWIDWTQAELNGDLVEFVRACAQLRRARRELRRDTFFKGSPRHPGSADVRWLHPAGREMADDDWAHPDAGTLGMLLEARDGNSGDLLVLVSAGGPATDFALPAGQWRVALDTAADGSAAVRPETSGTWRVTSQSLVVLEAVGVRPAVAQPPESRQVWAHTRES